MKEAHCKHWWVQAERRHTDAPLSQWCGNILRKMTAINAHHVSASTILSMGWRFIQTNTHLLNLFGREREEEEEKKRKGKQQREEKWGSCVDALKLFPSATNLRAAHGSYVRVRLAVFLFSPVVLTGQLGAIPQVKGHLSGSIHFLSLNWSHFYPSNEAQHIQYESLGVTQSSLCLFWTVPMQSMAAAMLMRQHTPPTERKQPFGSQMWTKS